MGTRPRLALLALLAAAALAACGDDDGRDGGAAATATTAEQEPGAATGGLPSGVPDQGGQTVEGTGYALTLPAGWADGTRSASGGAVDFDLVLLHAPEDGFATNVNVIRVRPEGRAPGLEDLRRSYRGELSAVGAEEISDPRDAEVDGEAAITYGYRQTGPQGQEVRGRQIATIRDGAVHTITLTAAASSFRRANGDFDEMIGSWSWSD